MKVLDKVSGTTIGDSQCGFRAYRTAILPYIMPTESGMSAGAEILRLAQEHDLKIAPVPVTIRYGKDTSTHNMFHHGLDVLLNSVKLASIRHPLKYYGLSGFALLAVSAVFWFWNLTNYASYKTIDVGLAIVASALTFVGLVLVVLGMLIWILASVVREAVR